MSSILYNIFSLCTGIKNDFFLKVIFICRINLYQTILQVKSIFPYIQDSSKQMIEYLGRKCDNNNNIEYNARHLSAQFTSNVVASCIYGFDGKSFNPNEDAGIICQMGVSLLKATKRIIVYSFITGALPFLTKIYKLTYIPKPIYNFFFSMAKNATELRQMSNTGQKDFVEFLLQLKEKKKISDIEIAAHALTFFFDGFETSGFGLGMTLYQLAKYPDIQKRLREEIIENFGDNDFDYDRLSDLPYLEAVLAEGMRLFPPVSNLAKICTQETEFPGINGGTLKIEKRMVVLIPVYEIHRNPAYYDKPNDFIPDRFLPENGGLKQYEEDCRYIAFGAGPRICIGKKFAKTQLKYALAVIVKNFDMSISHRMSDVIKFDPNQFILQPINGLWVNFKKLH